MADIFFFSLLGVLQSVTEWLPVSSSAHLFLAKVFLEHHFSWSAAADDFLSINVFFHFVTMLSLLFFFRKDFFSLIKNIRLLTMVAVADLPAAVVGLFFRDFVGEMAKDFLWLSFFFLVTAIVLFFSHWWQIKKQNHHFVPREIDEIRFSDAFFIGLIQSFTLFPGISRSGMTISAMLFCGFSPKSSAIFSMIMAIPLIFGAFVFEAKNILNLQSLGFSTMMISGILSFTVSFFVLKMLIFVVKRRKFYIFGYYLLLLSFTLFFVNIF